MKNVPQRTCVVCREKKEKSKLVRLVFTADSVSVDKTGRAAGRGAYVCADGDCMATAIKKHSLDRACKKTLSQETYIRLEAEFAEVRSGKGER